MYNTKVIYKFYEAMLIELRKNNFINPVITIPPSSKHNSHFDYCVHTVVLDNNTNNIQGYAGKNYLCYFNGREKIGINKNRMTKMSSIKLININAFKSIINKCFEYHYDDSDIQIFKTIYATENESNAVVEQLAIKIINKLLSNEVLI